MLQPRGQSKPRAGPACSSPHTHRGHSTGLMEALDLPCLKTRFREWFTGQPGSSLLDCPTSLPSVPEHSPHLEGFTPYPTQEVPPLERAGREKPKIVTSYRVLVFHREPPRYISLGTILFHSNISPSTFASFGTSALTLFA